MKTSGRILASIHEQLREKIVQVLADKVRQAAGETVPSHGLFLDEVYY